MKKCRAAQRRKLRLKKKTNSASGDKVPLGKTYSKIKFKNIEVVLNEDWKEKIPNFGIKGDVEEVEKLKDLQLEKGSVGDMWEELLYIIMNKNNYSDMYLLIDLMIGCV